MLTSQNFCLTLVGIAVVSQLTCVQAQAPAPAPAPGSVLESEEAAAARYPISAQQEQPLTNSASLPVTCNITFIGLSASSTPFVSTAGRRMLQAGTNSSLGLSTADIHCTGRVAFVVPSRPDECALIADIMTPCTGSYNLTIVAGPAVETFAPRWTGVFDVPAAADGLNCVRQRPSAMHETSLQPACGL